MKYATVEYDYRNCDYEVLIHAGWSNAVEYALGHCLEDETEEEEESIRQALDSSGRYEIGEWWILITEAKET